MVNKLRFVNVGMSNIGTIGTFNVGIRVTSNIRNIGTFNIVNTWESNIRSTEISNIGNMGTSSIGSTGIQCWDYRDILFMVEGVRR